MTALLRIFSSALRVWWYVDFLLRAFNINLSSVFFFYDEVRIGDDIQWDQTHAWWGWGARGSARGCKQSAVDENVVVSRVGWGQNLAVTPKHTVQLKQGILLQWTVLESKITFSYSFYWPLSLFVFVSWSWSVMPTARQSKTRVRNNYQLLSPACSGNTEGGANHTLRF